MSNKRLFRYNAKLNRVIDGDTMEMIVDHGFQIYSLKTIRLARCNTPETKGSERVAGLFVADQVQRLLNETESIVIQSHKIKKTFDRYVFDVFLDSLNLSEELLELGLAWQTDHAGKIIGKRNLRSLKLPKRVFDELESRNH